MGILALLVMEKGPQGRKDEGKHKICSRAHFAHGQSEAILFCISRFIKGFGIDGAMSGHWVHPGGPTNKRDINKLD